MAPFLLANFLATLYFAIYIFGGLRPPDRYGAKYNVARKLAKRNGAIIYANLPYMSNYPTHLNCLKFVCLPSVDENKIETAIWPSIFCIREGNLDQPYPRQVCWSFYPSPSPSPGRVQV